MTDDMREIQALSDRIAQLEAENEKLRLESDDLDRQLADLEDELERLSIENDQDQLDAHVDELEHDVESLSEENAELRAELTATEEAYQSSEARSALGSDEERVYLGSKNRRHFHRPNCEWASYIPDHRLIEFGSHAEAVAAGYKPCKTCRA